MTWRIDHIFPVEGGKVPQEPTSVLVDDGVISAIGGSAEGAEADQVTDGQQQWLMPGLIDLNCHLREPGPDRKGSIATETLAAARGGVTRVCTVPDTSPVNDSGAVTHLIQDLARRNGRVRVHPVGAMTRGLAGEHLSDMASLAGAGCVAMGNAGYATQNARVMRRCMAYARTFDLKLFIQPENPALAADGCAHDGVMAARLGLPGIPEVAETTAVNELLMLGAETEVRLHLGPLSCARSLDLVRAARESGQAVTCEVGITHLVATEGSIDGYEGIFHCRPPLRTEVDRQALLEGVESGVIDAIVSQHRPTDRAAKQAPFADTEPGLSTVESLLSLGLRLVSEGALSRERLLAALTSGPARILDQAPPSLEAGSPADFFLLTPGQSWNVEPESLLSSGAHAPTLGAELPGVVTLTALGGRVVYQA
ncbi:dihydroorotase [Halospina denitrificans]|uniref:Dihydroorotase n=1 Tax=Halospina denitrificans TaxID=332522 RepID=A0A4R7K0D3_9GAMM|nr:dihydroorotase [Halospina denitrificans]TDT44005.1 dihydroorotase [Halospina denitrificans]